MVGAASAQMPRCGRTLEMAGPLLAECCRIWSMRRFGHRARAGPTSVVDWNRRPAGDRVGRRRGRMLTGALFEQLHRDQPFAEPGAGGEGAHLSDGERAYLDGGAEHAQHPVLCGVFGQGGAGDSVRRRGRWGRGGQKRIWGRTVAMA